MHKNQGGARVKQSESTAIYSYQWNHDYLEWNNHRRNHSGEGELGSCPLWITHNHVCRHRREENGENRGECGNDCGVTKHTPEVHLAHGLSEVLDGETMGTNQRQRLTGNIAHVLECIGQYKEEWPDEDNQEHSEECDHKRMTNTLAYDGLFVFGR